MAASTEDKSYLWTFLVILLVILSTGLSGTIIYMWQKGFDQHNQCAQEWYWMGWEVGAGKERPLQQSGAKAKALESGRKDGNQ